MDSFRAALLDDFSYVINVLVVSDINIIPNLVPAIGTGNIGDFWDGVNFIVPSNPAYPPHP